MNKKLIEELRKSLEKEKQNTERALEKFAKKDDKVKGDWDTIFPKFNGGETGSAALEKAADEVEEYSTLLPIEHGLETKLRNVNLALEKVQKAAAGEPRQEREKYGVCEKCGKEIEIEKLKISPETRFCLKCQDK
jgi:DnaK suppressor protein